jgi:hypothetical protein
VPGLWLGSQSKEVQYVGKSVSSARERSLAAANALAIKFEGVDILVRATFDFRRREHSRENDYIYFSTYMHNPPVTATSKLVCGGILIYVYVQVGESTYVSTPCNLARETGRLTERIEKGSIWEKRNYIAEKKKSDKRPYRLASR